MSSYQKDLANAYKKMYKILDKNNLEKSNRSLITSRTQVGKTKSVIDLIKRTSGEWFITISCDNKKDQLNQFSSRLKKTDILCLTVSYCKNNIKNILEMIRNNKLFVIILLNNSFQVKTLNNIIKILKTNIKNYLCIHDEADVINKIDILDKETINNENKPIAKSHLEWVDHFELVERYFNVIRRVCVSATYEACSILFDIKAKDTIFLPTPSTYKDVNYFQEWDGDDVQLYEEIDRNRKLKNGEMILYCFDRKTTVQQSKAELISQEKNCICIAYNVSGFSIFGINVKSKKDTQISIVLEEIKQKNDHHKPIVIFGSELMKRGVSFVSSGDSPLTATVLFFNGKSSSIVNIVQKIGRITGTSRDDLAIRRLYSNKKVYEDYLKYIKNQKTLLNSLDKYENLSLNEILKIVDSEVIERDVDRKTLKKVNESYKISTSENNNDKDSGIDIIEKISDKNITKIKKYINAWWKAGTIIGKILEFVYENGKCNEEQLKTFIESIGGKPRTWITDLYQKNKKYTLVFYRDHMKNISLISEAREFIYNEKIRL